MTVAVLNQKGTETGSLQLKEAGAAVSLETFSLVVQYLQNQNRASVADTKDRGEVRGGGIKPWKQKGTGRARAGSSRSPLWRGGGITFGPTSARNFKTRIPQKMRQAALKAALLEKINQKQLVVVDTLVIASHKTKDALKLIETLKIEADPVGIVCDESASVGAFRNIAHVVLISADAPNLLDIAKCSMLIVPSSVFVGWFDTTEVKKAKPTKESV